MPPPISRAAPVPHTDYNRFAWSGLRRFQHIPSLTEQIMSKHGLSQKHRSNAAKQAGQIRHCLMQAQEYKDAAAATSLATRPLLLYYSMMSLALAQILYKGDGMSSLDAARGEHAHHGLVFNILPIAKNEYALKHTAASLRASPMIAAGRRRGTFELWHELAREDPFVGKSISYSQSGATTSDAYVILASSADKRLGYLDANGMSLYDCFVGTPGLSSWLGTVGVGTKIVRGQISLEHLPSTETKINFVIHPHYDKARYDELLNVFLFSAGAHPLISGQELDNGCVFSLTFRSNDAFTGVMPSAGCWTNQELRFLPNKPPLNEFGYLYIGLYILGNYARYHPDKWIADVEAGTPLALTSEEFIAMAEWRMALLTLSDLSETFYTPLA